MDIQTWEGGGVTYDFGKGYSVGCRYLDGDLAKMKIFSILFGGNN